MPRKPRDGEPGRRLTVRLSKEERQRVEQAARLHRQRLSEFTRDVLLDAIEESLENEGDRSFRPTKSEPSLTI